MSVDIFGRGSGELSQSVKAVRGPPGVGFKYTDDQQYDVEKKRLCNVAEPIKQEDAVTLRRLLNELSELKHMVESLERRHSERIHSQDSKIEGSHNLHARHSELILQLDNRLRALESQKEPNYFST